MSTTQQIIPADHCVQCDLSATDFNTGAYCSLTGAKPTFKSTCDKAQFDKAMRASIVAVNAEHQRVANAASGVHFKLITHTALGLVVIGAGIAFGLMMLASGWIETISWLIGGVGAGIVGKGLNSWVKHRQSRAVAERKRNRLNSLLARYGIGYEIDVEILPGPHDTEHITHNLQMKTVPRRAS